MNTCTHERLFRLLVCNTNFILLLELCNCSCNCKKLFYGLPFLFYLIKKALQTNTRGDVHFEVDPVTPPVQIPPRKLSFCDT